VSRLLQLPDNLYDRLERAAAAAKTTPIEWLDRHIPQPEDLPEPKPGSLYELIKDHIGVFDSGGGIEKMADDPNDPLFNILLEKKRKGTL
jgi:hypothetical protein